MLIPNLLFLVLSGRGVPKRYAVGRLTHSDSTLLLRALTECGLKPYAFDAVWHTVGFEESPEELAGTCAALRREYGMVLSGVGERMTMSLECPGFTIEGKRAESWREFSRRVDPRSVLGEAMAAAQKSLPVGAKVVRLRYYIRPYLTAGLVRTDEADLEITTDDDRPPVDFSWVRVGD